MKYLISFFMLIAQSHAAEAPKEIQTALNSYLLSLPCEEQVKIWAQTVEHNYIEAHLAERAYSIDDDLPVPDCVGKTKALKEKTP